MILELFSQHLQVVALAPASWLEFVCLCCIVSFDLCSGSPKAPRVGEPLAVAGLTGGDAPCSRGDSSRCWIRECCDVSELCAVGRAVLCSPHRPWGWPQHAAGVQHKEALHAAGKA